MNVKTISISAIDLPNYLLRQTMDEGALDDLAFSIAKDGLINPVTVKELGERYLLITGLRRLKACISLGHSHIAANVIDPTMEQQAILPLVENIKRKDVDPIEEAMYIDHLVKDMGLNHEQVANFMGKDRTTIAHRLSLLQLDPFARQAISDGKISPAAALILKRVSDPKRRAYLFETAAKFGCTVDRAEAWVQHEIPRFEPPEAPPLAQTEQGQLPPPVKYTSFCQVCDKECPLDDITSIYTCPSCLKTLNAVKEETKQ